MEPRVTVIIPNYNYNDYIKRAIQSAIDQTYQNISICVIDDGSDDFEKLKSIFNKLLPLDTDKTVTGTHGDIFTTSCGNHYLISLKKNSGPSTARNIGINLTINQTQAFVNLDSDDYMYPNKVEELIKAWLIDTDKIGVVYADYDIENTSNSRKVIEFKHPYSMAKLERECIVHSGALISSKALIQVCENDTFYDPGLRTCEDFDLWLRISQYFMIYHVPKPLTNVLVQPRNSSVSVDQTTWNQNWSTVMQKLTKRKHEKK